MDKILEPIQPGTPDAPGQAPAVLTGETVDMQVSLEDFRVCLQLARSERLTQVEPAWKDAYEIIRCLPRANYPLSTNHAYGLTTANIYNMVARLYAGIFHTDGIVFIHASGEISKEEARFLQDRINLDLKRQRFSREMLQALLDFGIYGTGNLKVLYDNLVDQFRMRENGSQQFVRYQGPSGRYLTLEDSYPDPGAGWDLRASDYWFHCTPITFGELLVRAESNGYEQAGMEAVKKAGRGSYGVGTVSEIASMRRWNRRIDTGQTPQFAPIWLEEGWFNCGDHWEVIHAAQLGGGNQILLKQWPESPYWWINGPPTVQFRSVPLPNENPGMGVIEPSKGLQYELDDVKNLKLEIGKQLACPVYVVDPNTGITSDMVRFSPNAILYDESGKPPQPLNKPSPPNWLQLDAETIRRDLEIVQSVSSTEKGDVPNERTAKQTMLRLSQGATRINMDLEDIGNGLVEMVRMFIGLYYQFGQEEEPLFAHLHHPDEYEIDANLTAQGIREQHINELMQYFQLGEKHFLPQQSNVLLESIGRELRLKEVEQMFPEGSEAQVMTQVTGLPPGMGGAGQPTPPGNAPLPPPAVPPPNPQVAANLPGEVLQ